MTNDDLRLLLAQEAEMEYQAFSSKLLPNIAADKIWGVRLPKLRNIAQTIAKNGWQNYLLQATTDTFEELMLQGLVIGAITAPLEEIMAQSRLFIAKIDNWSVCDSFCASLKSAQQFPDQWWQFIQPYFASSEEYQVRFAVVMLLDYFIDDSHIEQVLHLLESIDNHQYYVQMAVAWAISICYIKLPTQTMPFLQENRLDKFTHNKALQKIIDSLRVDAESKTLIRSLKR